MRFLLFYSQILELPFLGELIIVGIELELICLEAYFIEKWIESLEVHLVYILLFDSLCKYWLISKTYGSTPLRLCELIVFYNINIAVQCLSHRQYGYLHLLQHIRIPIRWLLLIKINLQRSITERHLIIPRWYWIIPEIHEAVPSESRGGWSAVIGGLIVHELHASADLMVGVGLLGTLEGG